MLDIIIQVILAILLLLIMGFLAYSIYDNEYIKSIKLNNTNKKETKILDGIYEFNQPTYTVDTMNTYDPRYLDINPSVNQTGGAEYSYNFWLYYNIKDPNSTLITGDRSQKYIVLFYKGLRNLVNYNQFDYSCDTKSKTLGAKKYLLVKNPLVKLSNDGTHLIIEYNNINTPDTFNSSSNKKNCKITGLYDNMENKLGIKDMDNRLFNKSFNMITIVMQESPENEDELFVNRTNCKVYLNGTLISNRSTLNNDLASESSTDSYSTVMKKNIGNLYINPFKHFEELNNEYQNTQLSEITESDDITRDVPLKMADLTYFNYALSPDDVSRLFLRKFNTNLVKPISIVDPKSINVGNKFNKDLYDSDTGNAVPVKSI
jgi:hypothetical protein